MKSLVLQSNWVQPPDGERWLRRMAKGRTLNVCSGMSRVGDVRIDIDPVTNRTEAGDLFDLKFSPRSFDTVICDPPFRYYVTGENRFRWIGTIRNIAKSRVIISTDKVNPTNFFYERKWDIRHFALVKGTPFVRYWWVFDRKDSELPTYSQRPPEVVPA